MVLAWELAEPTVLRVSPTSDSVSSGGGGCAASDIEAFRWDLDWKTSSGREVGVVRPFWLAGLDDGDSAAFILALSRSTALSLADLGADGKNWAKLAPDGGGIATICYFHRSLRPPLIISRVRTDKIHHASVVGRVLVADEGEIPTAQHATKRFLREQTWQIVLERMLDEEPSRQVAACRQI